MPSETLSCVARVQTNILENVLSTSSVFLRVIGFHSCVIVETLLLSLIIEEYYYWSKNTVLWDAFMAVSVPVSVPEGIFNAYSKLT
jgi:hypothetical protein